MQVRIVATVRGPTWDAVSTLARRETFPAHRDFLLVYRLPRWLSKSWLVQKLAVLKVAVQVMA